MTAALFSYVISLMVTSPLAAFAVSAGYQVVMFIVRRSVEVRYVFPQLTLAQLYTADYLLILTYAKSTLANHEMSVTREFAPIQCELVKLM